MKLYYLRTLKIQIPNIYVHTFCRYIIVPQLYLIFRTKINIHLGNEYITKQFREKYT